MIITLIFINTLFIITILIINIFLSRKISEYKDRRQELTAIIQQQFNENRKVYLKEAFSLKEEINLINKSSNEMILKMVDSINHQQQEYFKIIEREVVRLTEANEAKFEQLKNSIEKNLHRIEENNERKLEQIRETVNEKLQTTLERRLGESFRQVSERLEAVSKGLGQMQSLASGVGDLKKILTNIKIRGTWGEIQVEDILEQILTSEQFEKNVKTKRDSNESVEFAIKLPGQDKNLEYIWLPIDSKFPIEDYQRLLDASENGDKKLLEKSAAQLRRAIEKAAKDIAEKYINPPYTTDFAIMFLPSEGLYSEVLRQGGLAEKLQQQYRIVIAGPMTLSAMIFSLKMGFRTLAIEKRSSEVWQILAAVKVEFKKFEQMLKTLSRQLRAASNTIEKTETRTRIMEKKLKDVESLPEYESMKILGIGDDNEESKNLKIEENSNVS